MGVFDRISGLTGGDAESTAKDDGPAATSPDSTDPDAMGPADFRDRAEDLAGRSNVPMLDFTVESLEKLDGLVAGTSPPVDDPVTYGSYLGEVLVRVFDGTWVEDDGPAVAVDQGNDDTTVAVFDAARMALERGPVFRDVVGKLESEGAMRAEELPPAHREIETAETPTSAQVEDPEPDEPEPGETDSTADAVEDSVTDADDGEELEPTDPDDGEGAVATEPDTGEETDESAAITDESPDDESDDAVDAVEETGADEQRGTDEDETSTGNGSPDTTDAPAAEDAADGEDPTADPEVDDINEPPDDPDEETDADDTDVADEKPELDVTIDEIPDDDSPLPGVGPGADGDDSGGDEATPESTDAGADGAYAASAPDDGEESVPDADDEEDQEDIGRTVESVEPEPDETADEEDTAPSTAEPATDDGVNDSAAPESTVEAVDTTGEPADDDRAVSANDADGAEDDGDLGVASEIAELAAGDGPADAATSPGDELADAESDAAAVDEESPADEDDAVGDAEASDDGGDEDAAVEGSPIEQDGEPEADVGERTDAEEAETDAEETVDDGDAVSPVDTTEAATESVEPSAGTGAVDESPGTADDAGPAAASSDDSADEVLGDLAAEVSGPDLPPRPELKRAARDFSDEWSDRGFDFTPESLARLDEFVDRQWDGRFRPGSLEDASPHPREGLAPFARVGAYVGQMLVEHLDGEWVPTENGEGAVEVSGRRGTGREVHVFDVARTCLTEESTFAYRFDALANRVGVDAAAREVDDVFDVEGDRADSTAVIPTILDHAEVFAGDWPDADLDYSPASLGRLDDLVDRRFAVTDLSTARLGETTDADSLRFTERVTAAGAYYAAVMVSHLDANWRLEGDVRLIVEGSEGSRTVDPVTVAVGAIRGDDAFADHFDRLADRVGRDPATADSD